MKLKDCQRGMKVRVARPPRAKPILAGWQGRIEKVPEKPKNGAWLVRVRFVSGVAWLAPEYLEAG